MTSNDRTAQVRYSDHIAPAFHGLHKSIRNKEYTTYLLKGGRGSTKSSFTAIEIILGIMADPLANAFVTRKVGDTIRLSVLNTLLWAIEILNVNHLFSHTRAPAEITYIPTGQKIIMKGLDDPLKVKSIKIKKGYFKYLWFEEAAEFNGVEEIRSVEQSILRGGDEFVEFITYNPPNDPAAWVNKHADLEIPDRKVHHSTYLDVPPQWLGKKFIEDAKSLEQYDDVAYQHEYLGLAVGRAEQIVFHGKWEIAEFSAPDFTQFYFGADWGFATDPSVLVRNFILDDTLYIEYEAYGYGVELDDLPALFDTIPEVRRWTIKADSSRPETISHLRRKGFKIAPADKWPGSVEDGIEHVKTFKKIVIHPRCVKMIEEARLYSYKVDKVTKEVLPLLKPGYDHGWDSVRYSLDKYIQRRGSYGQWAKLAG